MHLATASKRSLPKEVWIGWVSSLSEAYNMAIYSFVAPLLAPLLFPNSNSWSALFFSYALLFLGSCVLYPAGALYYGLIGDRLGRQRLCIYSTLGLAIATGLMGVVPIHWISFLLLIGAQHFFSGGEYHGSIVFSLEHGENKKSGLMSSLSCLFAVFGLVSASGLATLALATGELFWMRVCFFMGALGGFISYFLKNFCRETPAFSLLSQAELKPQSWACFLRGEWQQIVSVVLVLAVFISSYSFIFIFLPAVNIEANIQEAASFKSLLWYGLFLVVSGLLADQWGVRKTIVTGILFFAAAVFPLTYLCPDLFLLQMALTPFACLVIGPIHGWMLHQFPPSHRCRGIFVSSAIATSLFGGSTVPVCLLIFEYSHSLSMCSLYPLTIALCAWGNLIYWGEPKKVLA